MIDYRAERRLGFKVFHVQGMRMDEIDPAAPMLRYIVKALKLDIEQKVWLSWLYSTCYSAPTAYYMICHLPHPDKSLAQVKCWWQAHRTRLVFETDRLRVKTENRFPDMYASYKQFFRSGAFKTFLSMLKSSPEKSYDSIFDAVGKGLFYFGRYSMFMYLETIYNLTALPMKPLYLNLKEARSSRNGLCFALGKDGLVQKDGELSKEQYEFLQKELHKLYCEIVREYPGIPTTYWNLETSLCAYKKLFWATRYCGYYIDRQMTEIQKMERLSPDGVDWSLLWQFRRAHFNPRALGEVGGWKGVRKERLQYFLKTGQFCEEEMPSASYA